MTGKQRLLPSKGDTREQSAVHFTNTKITKRGVFPRRQRRQTNNREKERTLISPSNAKENMRSCVIDRQYHYKKSIGDNSLFQESVDNTQHVSQQPRFTSTENTETTTWLSPEDASEKAWRERRAQRLKFKNIMLAIILSILSLLAILGITGNCITCYKNRMRMKEALKEQQGVEQELEVRLQRMSPSSPQYCSSVSGQTSNKKCQVTQSDKSQRARISVGNSNDCQDVVVAQSYGQSYPRHVNGLAEDIVDKEAERHTNK